MVTSTFFGKKARGFALPTVLISSVVMMIVLLGGLQSLASVGAAINSQYIDRLNQQAVDAGVAMAEECYRISGVWTGQTLEPGDNCDGTPRSSCNVTPPALPTNNGCFVLSTNSIKTRFSVEAPAQSGTNIKFKVNASVYQFRTSDTTRSTATASRTISGTGAAAATFATLPPIKAGNDSVCAINNAGDLYCWGLNSSKQVNPTSDSVAQASPYKINFADYGLGQLRAYDAAVAASHTCVTAGTEQTPAVNDSRLVCWGGNADGQMGVGVTNATLLRQPFVSLPPLSAWAFTKVSGRDNTCVITETVPGRNEALKRLHCTGLNNGGQSGDDANNTEASNATGVSPQNPKTKFSGNGNSSLIQTSATGNFIRRAGTGSNGLHGMMEVTASGQTYACAIHNNSSDGTAAAYPLVSNRRAMCWGRNDSGRLGNASGTTNYTSRAIPVSSAADSNGYSLVYVRKIYANAGKTCAIDYDNEIFCWGSNDSNRMASYARTEFVTPFRMRGNVANSPLTPSTSSYPVDLAVSDQGTCFIKSDGKIYCWGFNEYAQLGQVNSSGDATTSGQVSPNTAVQVVGVSNELASQRFDSIAAGTDFYCAITDKGALYCWGRNHRGQIGNGRISAYEPPTRVNVPINTLQY